MVCGQQETNSQFYYYYYFNLFIERDSPRRIYVNREWTLCEYGLLSSVYLSISVSPIAFWGLSSRRRVASRRPFVSPLMPLIYIILFLPIYLSTAPQAVSQSVSLGQ